MQIVISAKATLIYMVHFFDLVGGGHPHWASGSRTLSPPETPRNRAGSTL